MLEISNQTFSAFEIKQRNQFIDSLVSILRQEMPNECLAKGQVEVRALVARTVDRADKWQIEESEPVGQLCALALGFGEAIFDDPDVATYLADHDGDATERVAALLDEIEALPDE